MTIYIDNDYKCHVTEQGRAFDVSFFDGKCDTFIEGYRYVPQGETWTREDGEIFSGEMISPWQDYTELERAQYEHEIADMRAALEALGVTING